MGYIVGMCILYCLWAQVAVLDKYIVYIGLFGTGICRYCIWVELLVQKRLCPIFRKWRRVTRPPLVFRGLTGSQRTPGFWGVTEAESSRARGHGPQVAPGEGGNEATLGGHAGNEELHHPQQRAGELSWEQRFKNLQQELSRVKKVVRGRAPDTMDTLVQQTESPFTAEVLYFPLPSKFRMPQVEAFDGAKDPVDHLNTYKNQMELHGYQDLVRCRAFAITLKGPALAWFNRLPPSSISLFKELSITFVSHFIRVRTYRKSSYHLLTIKQGPQENLRSYVQIFNVESLKVDIPDEKFAITAFIAVLGVQSKDLMFSISKNPQASMAKVLAKAEKYINGEEALIFKKESSSTHKEKTE